MTTPEAQATAAARAELYDTLSQLRGRLDYAQRIDDRVADTKQRIARQRKEKPLVFAAGIASVAAIAGLAAWRITRAVIDALD